MNILILAGGTGSRLWPISRKSQPKQLLSLINNQTLLQTTYERFSGIASADEIFLGTTAAYAPSIRKQLPTLPKRNMSIEPMIKERAPAIGLGTLLIDHYYPDSVFMTAWSDHYIKETSHFIGLLKQAERFVKAHPDTPVIVGVTPRSAATGYGYIEVEGSELRVKDLKTTGRLPLYQVRGFKEKPDLKTAERFLKSGKFLWSTTSIIWNTRTVLALYAKYLPEIYELLMEIKPFIGTSKQQKIINAVYPKMPKMDLEKGLLEKLDNLVALKADVTWADVGSWKTIKEVLSRPGDNLVKGRHHGHTTTNSLIYNYTDQLVATVGLDDMVVVVTKEAVLVSKKEDAELLKDVLKQIEADPGAKRFL